MSEELLQTTSKQLGRYLYYKLGASTLGQLKKEKIIKGKFSSDISNKKPDGLIVLAGGDVKAVIEYKPAAEFKTEAQINKAINQEIEVARQLCKLLIVTSGKKTVWVNALNGERVLSEDGNELSKTFDVKPIVEQKLSNEKQGEIEQLIDKIDHSLTETNNQIFMPEVLDPSSLARTIWQKIWINTGKEPEKCLYNVVELFVFKFLSDVGVLHTGNNFNSVLYLDQTQSSNVALKHYARICRRDIKELFPKGRDGTTVINGTIFVNEKGEPNAAQSSLFSEVLKHLQEYDSKFGSFKYIKKEFKTRLYETFLRQSAGVGFLGQYFTPRNVVRAMVAMSDASQLKKGARICDPFCGVGGFLLELIVDNKHIWNEFEPRNGKVSPEISIVGYDKGSDEKEDERTIILAKANMLIYFSDLLVKYHTPEYLKTFAEDAFNDVFHLIRTNLGTFGKVDDEPYDLILTNPPYVTSGSSSLKKAIDDNGISSHYEVIGRGTESLAMEWITNNLKAGGQALVVVPDGLLNQRTALNYLKSKCVIQGVVSLPSKTFYSTTKKTYILMLKKKLDSNEEQTTPVFTYFVSEIGESRDTNRFDIQNNDLNELTALFNQFKGAYNHFVSHSPRCKIFEYNEFKGFKNWLIDTHWSTAEQNNLHNTTDNNDSKITFEELPEFLEQIIKNISSVKKLIVEQSVKKKTKLNFREYFVSDLFNTISGNSKYTASYINQHKGEYPVFSSNTKQKGVFGFVDTYDYNTECIQITTNGANAGTVFYREKQKFSINSDARLYLLKDNQAKIDYSYIAIILRQVLSAHGFNWENKPSIEKTQNIKVVIPTLSNGDFDIDEQRAIVKKYEAIDILKSNVHNFIKQLSQLKIPVLQDTVAFKALEIESIFEIPSIKGISKGFIDKNQGEIPVYGGKILEEPVGYVQDNLIGVKYFDNCLAWNRNGSTGYVFWHKHRFSTTDDHRPLILKPEYVDKINLDYTRYVIEQG